MVRISVYEEAYAIDAIPDIRCIKADQFPVSNLISRKNDPLIDEHTSRLIERKDFQSDTLDNLFEHTRRKITLRVYAFIRGNGKYFSATRINLLQKLAKIPCLNAD